LTCEIWNDVIAGKLQKFLKCVSKVAEIVLDDTYSDADPVILELITYAEGRVNSVKGKGKRMVKGQKYSSVFQIVPWVRQCYVLVFLLPEF
jgi:hypothetical protein